MKMIDQLKQVHPHYEQIAETSDYMRRSFQGGEAYRSGEYLTRYLGESSGPGDQYQKRLDSTPLHNHVKTTVDIYRSFLFRELPTREQGSLLDNPLFQDWIKDTDNDGQGINSFMKTINDMALVQSGVWILVDKPAYKVETVAQEQALSIRAYTCVYNVASVLDWVYERNIAGKQELVYIKVKEADTKQYTKFSVWTKDQITKYTVAKTAEGQYDQITHSEEYSNPLGVIPFVFYAPGMQNAPGVGVSMVEGVADIQRAIYDLTSQLYDTITISSHPTLVKPVSVDASAGAGNIINLNNDQDPGLNPYLLQPTGATVDGILSAIEKHVENIKTMTHTTAVSATKTSSMSGIAMQTERQLLNSVLSDMSDNLQECELKLHKLWAMWHNIELPSDFEVFYAKTFDMRDNLQESTLYKQLLEINPHDSFKHYVHNLTVDMVVEDANDAREIKESIAEDHRNMNVPVIGEDQQ